MLEGKPVTLVPKAYETLLALVINNGRIVERAELMKLIWPDRFVGEASLSVCISTLRKALGENSVEHRYIVTVPGRGYKFAGSVREIYTDSNTTMRGGSPDSLAQREQERDGLPVIAVLPFKNLSEEAGDSRLGIGIADTLITKLGSLRWLLVRPTSAVLKYAEDGADPVAAGAQLRANLVLEGSIRKWADRVRVTVQVVSIEDGATLWSAKFDEKFRDIFEVEDSISEKLAEALALKLSGREELLLNKRYTENVEAYRLYLNGRYHWSQKTQEETWKAIECFEQAIEYDSDYGLAYVGLADCYFTLGLQEALLGGMPPKDAFSKARTAVLKALAVDNALAEAHVSLGNILNWDWDWAGAEREYRRASR
ncbi:MAG: winged helix-turn-helix domain-containing protein [Blastocatellia bacterium]|nr:winged helix-turn-helix domain-containing protein [Blastocatellia bacterium]